MHDTVFVGAFLQELSKAPVGTRTSTWWKGNNPTGEKKTKEKQEKKTKHMVTEDKQKEAGVELAQPEGCREWKSAGN